MRGPKGGLGRQWVIGRNDQSADGVGGFSRQWCGGGEKSAAATIDVP